MAKVRLSNIVEKTTALGPGNRAAVWFQGCLKRCPGCMSPDTRDVNGGTEVEVRMLLNALFKLKDIEGITISGGEPFLQTDALYELAEGIKNNSGLSVIIYTGYTIDELRIMNDEKINKIIECTDILIDGEYVEELNDDGRLRGSSNQVAHFLSDRYKGYENMYGVSGRVVDIRMYLDEVSMIGIPSKEALKDWKELFK